jgi:tripartite-type tricarboxylate transporter receptor subunit TctC
MKHLLTAMKHLLAAIAFAVIAGAAAAQPFPSRPIRIIVPYPPGALTDLLGRTIGDRLSAALKQPVVIENKPGAGTLVGAEYVAKSAPDGYVLLLATSTTLGISPALYKNSPINPIRDFAPIYEIGTVNFFLIGHRTRLPVKSSSLAGVLVAVFGTRAV